MSYDAIATEVVNELVERSDKQQLERLLELAKRTAFPRVVLSNDTDSSLFRFIKYVEEMLGHQVVDAPLADRLIVLEKVHLRLTFLADSVGILYQECLKVRDLEQHLTPTERITYTKLHGDVYGQGNS